MKTLIIVAALTAMMVMASTSILIKAERMTVNEIKTIRACETKVTEAQADFDAVKLAIARAHGIAPERWLEWATTFNIDGDYILETHHDFMR